MTSLISKMAGPKPAPEPDTAPAERSRLAVPRFETGDSLTKKLLVAQQSKPEAAENGTTDLLLRGLVDRLPKPDSIWPLDDRAKWLRTAISIFDLVYETSQGEERGISVGLVKLDA